MSENPPHAWDPDGWNDDLAAALVGKTVLVGITHCTPDDDVVRREQFHGFVVSADRREGIVLQLDGVRVGERYVLPPSTYVFERARMGEYRLAATGEVVHDPNYIATYVVYPRADA